MGIQRAISLCIGALLLRETNRKKVPHRRTSGSVEVRVQGDKDARSRVKDAASSAMSLSRNCSSNVEMIGKPVALFWVIPGVLKTNDVVKRNVAQAMAAPTADATGIADPRIRTAAVVSSIVSMILAS